MLRKLEAWHRTRAGLLLFAIFELLVASILVGRALDTGGTLYYLGFLLFLVGALANLVQLLSIFMPKGARRGR